MTCCLKLQSFNFKLFYFSVWGQHWGQLKLVCHLKKLFACKFHIILFLALLVGIAHGIMLTCDVGRSTRNYISSSPFWERQKKSSMLFSSRRRKMRSLCHQCFWPSVASFWVISFANTFTFLENKEHASELGAKVVQLYQSYMRQWYKTE